MKISALENIRGWLLLTLDTYLSFGEVEVAVRAVFQ